MQKLPVRLLFLLLLFRFVTALPAGAQSTSPVDLPLFHIGGLQYEGAFRVPADRYGDSEMNYSEGPLAYNPVNHSVFIVGHSHQQAIAEFALPPLVKSDRLEDLQMASAPLQVFSELLGRVSGGNPQDMNRIGGLCLVSGSSGQELLVNAYEYYDAPGDDTHTTFVVRNPASIAGSQVDGFFEFAGGAGHTSGWISPIPSEWQALLGGSHITGQSSGIPIISRTSVGPSAFVFDPLTIVGQSSVPNPISTTRLLDFDLQHPLAADLSNDNRNNDLWTHLSRAIYGFIPPGTRSYVTIGHSGGHRSGVCYKCTQNNGNTCGGYCAPDASDYYHYYWLWDLNDLLAVKAGSKNSYDVRPYEYGVFPTAFKTNQLGGGSFDPASGLLYLTVQEADDQQGVYANPPVIVAYRFNADAGSSDPGSNPGSDPGANPGQVSAIGKAGNKNIYCVKTSGSNMARMDRGATEGSLVPVGRALSMIKKALSQCETRLRAGSTKSLRKKRRALKTTLSRAKLCRSGRLAFD